MQSRKKMEARGNGKLEASTGLPAARRPGRHFNEQAIIRVFIALVILAFLFLLGRHNFLLFHGLVELSAVAVAWGVFILIRNARRISVPVSFLMLGTGYMLVGVFDLLHTLAYEGMGVFPGSSADLATQLWIAARFLETAALVLFPISFSMVAVSRYGGPALVAFSIFLLAGIFIWDVFPQCFNPQTGLTPFKTTAEYVVMGLLGVAVLMIRKRRRLIGEKIVPLITGALLVTIVSEFFFTLYESPYGLANMTGHLLKVLSFMLIYRALIVEGLERPIEVLGRGLREENELYTGLIATATDGFLIVDMEGRIRDVNESAVRMLGYPRDTLLTMSLRDFDGEDPEEGSATRIESAAARGHDLFETRYRHRDGSVFDAEVSCGYLPHQGGRIIVFVRDISSRKKAEEELRIKEEKYRQLFRNAPAGIYEIDFTTNRLVSINDVASEYLGYTNNELMNINPLDLLGESSRDMFVGRLKKYAAGEYAPEQVECELVAKNGRRLWVLMNARFITQNNRVTGATVVVHDLTERKKMQENLMRASEREQTKLAQELHDGLCQDLKGLEIQATLLEDLVKEQNNNAKNLAAGLADGMNLAVRRAYAIAQGLFPVHVDTTGFTTALAKLAETMCHLSEARLIVNIQTDLSPGNQEQANHLYRISQEALTNALRHSKATEIELCWSREKQRNVLAIHDNGIGIKDDQWLPAKGMGLMVMRSRAQIIGSDLTVQSGPGYGTEVMVRLLHE
jgi:PAS domain S-box-containing protein